MFRIKVVIKRTWMPLAPVYNSLLSINNYQFFILYRAQFASVDEVHKEEIRREKRR